MLSGFFYSKVVFPAYHWLKHDNVNRAIKELRTSDKLPVEKLNEIQRSKLARLLDHAKTHVPYYREIINKTGLNASELADPVNFRNLPVLTKPIITDHLNELVSDDLKGNRLFNNSTSGSTSSALYFYTDRRSREYRSAAVVRNHEWIGINIYDRQIRLWGSPIDIDKGKNFRKMLHALITGDRLFSAYELSEESMAEYALEIKKFRPALLTAYPSVLEVFAEFCLKNNIAFPSLRAIILSAETLWDYQRELFSSVYKIPVYNRYGCREVGDIAHECTDRSGLHINTERIYVEIADTDGQSCAPGEKGEILVTDLDNYGMPLIRYRMGDIAAWSNVTTCACGRSHPKLSVVEGRTMDVIFGTNGAKIGGTFWTILLRSKPGIKKYQVIQSEPNGVDIDISAEAGLEKATLDYYTEKIREKCGNDFQVNFRTVSCIPASHTGKQRYIINKL